MTPFFFTETGEIIGRYSTAVVGTIIEGYTENDVNYLCFHSDDQIQIQAAIDDVSSKGGGKVLLLNGEYLIAGTITLKPNVMLSGIGDTTILFRDFHSAYGEDPLPMISILGGNCCITKLKTYNDRRRNNLDVSIYDWAGSSSNTIITNITIDNEDIGIELEDGNNIIIKDNIIKTTSRAISLQSVSAGKLTNVVIDNNVFDCAISPSENIRIWSAENVVISNNIIAQNETVVGNVSNNGTGISIIGANVKNIDVIGNTIYKYNIGIYSTVTNNKICDNFLVDNVTGISISSPFKNGVITGNVIKKINLTSSTLKTVEVITNATTGLPTAFISYNKAFQDITIPSASNCVVSNNFYFSP